jgi:NADPH2:quinone reductase
MKIVRYHEKGAPDVLLVEDLPVPEPSDGEVLVRVEAAGINYADTLRRSGRHYPVPTELPHSPGNEVVGIIEQLGTGVDAAKLGQRVFATVSGGGYAEYAVARVEQTFTLMPGLDPVDAMAVFSQGLTAAVMLREAAHLKEGETILVPAAAGGVGSLAVQLSCIFGASKVIGLASSPEKREIVLGLGASAAVDYTKEGWAKDVLDATDGIGVDIALETSGGAVFYETLNAVRQQRGRVVVFGNSNDEAVSVNPRQLLVRNMTLTGFFIPGYPELRDGVLEELSHLVVEHKLIPQIGGTFPLEEAPRAHAMIGDRRSTGKLIFVPA